MTDLKQRLLAEVGDDLAGIETALEEIRNFWEENGELLLGEFGRIRLNVS